MKDNLLIYICDDDFAFTKVVEERLSSIISNRKYETKCFDNGKDLIKQFKARVADAVFIDIDMPEMSGYDVAIKLREIKRDAMVTFITSYEELAFQSYSYHPFTFIKKSNMQELENNINDLIKHIDFNNERSEHIVYLYSCGNVTKIDLFGAMYIDCESNNITIHYKTFRENARCKLQIAEEQLREHGFIQIQRGILVNYRFISKITRCSVELEDGKKFNIGRVFKEPFIDAYEKLIGRKTDL